MAPFFFTLTPGGEVKMLTTVSDYTTILAKLQQIAPEAHIAGGAVRDTILEKPIHDIDVFMAEGHVDEAAALLRPACKYVKVGEWKQYLGFSDPAMTRVAKFEKAEETIPVCIIGLKPSWESAVENLSRFDFGVCMAAFNGSEFLRTDKFDQDVKAKTFTLHRADNYPQFAYSMCRFEKITSGRYQGWSLVVSNEFEELAKERTFRRHWYLSSEDDGLHPTALNELRPKERVAAHQ
jgi:hypothetical protein